MNEERHMGLLGLLLLLALVSGCLCGIMALAAVAHALLVAL